jgi:curved DNA-binding protein
LRLRGRGLPKRGGESGDLHAVVKIVVPKTLTDRERALYEQLAESSAPDEQEA